MSPITDTVDYRVARLDTLVDELQRQAARFEERAERRWEAIEKKSDVRWDAVDSKLDRIEERLAMDRGFWKGGWGVLTVIATVSAGIAAWVTKVLPTLGQH